MTDNNHPITPPPELLQQWATEYWGKPVEMIHDSKKYIATQAARWGADQELEACCEWLEYADEKEKLRAVRRPKPPSLKEQALEALNEAVYMSDDSPPEGISTDKANIIRRALESLPD